MKRVLIIPSCGEVHEGLTEFMEHAQPWHRRLGYRLHFLICSACRKLLAAFQALPGRVRATLAPEPVAPPEAKEALGRTLQRLGKDRPDSPRG
jgi:hypothetical protein